MNHKEFFLSVALIVFAVTNVIASNNQTKPKKNLPHTHAQVKPFHTRALSVHKVKDEDPFSFYPTALLADEQVIEYIAGTPVVGSPYLGSRPAFDGADYIINISSINRDVRLMEQRRRLYDAYTQIGYPIPDVPIISLSGKVEPIGYISHSYSDSTNADLTLGSSELDVAAILNQYVEGFIGIAYDQIPPPIGSQRVGGAFFSLSLGFINIGNLDQTPWYFTAGQLYAPFGRFSSSMISAPLPLRLARIKARPFILGYKSQQATGPYAALYAFKSDTTLGSSGVPGVNLGYTIKNEAIHLISDLGISFISSVNDATGMQWTNAAPGTTFGGFGSLTNGNEAVTKIPAVDLHATLSLDRYALTGEWVGVTRPFHPQDLSFNGNGANPQAAQLEAGVTFNIFDKPASLAAGYQWSQQTLALNLPHRRVNGVFNISLWKDTVESFEYRHDKDFSTNDFANGAFPIGGTNINTIGTGNSADTFTVQIGVYF